jgi:hypothetical protein
MTEVDGLADHRRRRSSIIARLAAATPIFLLLGLGVLTTLIWIGALAYLSLEWIVGR